MPDFLIRFFISNVFISGIIVLLLIAKKIFKNSLSSRMHYHLWFLLPELLAVPFVPFPLIRLPELFPWFDRLQNFPSINAGTEMSEAESADLIGNISWMNDFAVSVNSRTPSII